MTLSEVGEGLRRARWPLSWDTGGRWSKRLRQLSRAWRAARRLLSDTSRHAADLAYSLVPN